MKTITVKFTICDKKYLMILTFNLFTKGRVCLYEEYEKKKNITPLKIIPVTVQYTGTREIFCDRVKTAAHRLKRDFREKHFN